MSDYVDMSAAFIYREAVLWPQLDQLAENDSFLKDNGWQDSTKAIFYQAAAPTGWTKVVTQNDKMLRVVSGTGGGAGGSTALSATVTRAHTHTIGNQAAHSHTLVPHAHDYGFDTDTGRTPTYAVSNSGNQEAQVYAVGSGRANEWIGFSFANSAGTETSSSDGAHDHGGVTDSSLANLALAYIDVIVCSKDTSSGYSDETAEFSHIDKIDFDPFALLEANDNYLQPRLTPSGSVSLFYNSAAPSGWTKLTTHNDKALRVVSGIGGGSGGTDALSSELTAQHTHGHTAAVDHTHSTPAHVHAVATSGESFTTLKGYLAVDGSYIRSTLTSAVSKTVIKGQTTSSGSGTSGAAGAHSHTINNSLTNSQFAYVDVIQCSKDSAGAPYVFQDLSLSVVWKKLVSKQRLNNFGKNDSHMKFHTIPAAAVCYFFQAAAPLTWTKQTTNDDKALRIVSGSGGASGGGSQGVSSALVLAHTHVIVAAGSHGHTVPSHTHPFDTATEANAGNFDSDLYLFAGLTGSTIVSTASITSSGTATKKMTTTSQATASAVLSTIAAHDHGGATGSSLSNVTFAYIDMIACTKN